MEPYCGEEVALADTVVSLLGDLAGYGYRIYMDNLYKLVMLCHCLLSLKTHVFSTLRKSKTTPTRHVCKYDVVHGQHDQGMDQP